MNSRSNFSAFPNITLKRGLKMGDGEVLRPSVGSSGEENKKATSKSGDEVYFNITRSSQLKRVMIVSCDRHSLKLNDIYFLFEGRRVLREETPDQLKMKNGDVIGALLDQREGVLNLHDDDQSTAPSAPIHIKIWNNTRYEVITFRMKKSTQLKKLMTAYCHPTSLKESCVRFLFFGGLFGGNRTPAELGMEDGAESDALRNLPYCDCCPLLPSEFGPI